MYGKANSTIPLLATAKALGDGSSAAVEVTTDAFQYWASNYNTRIIVYANTEITVAQTKLLNVDLKQSATEGGTYTNVAGALRLVAPTGGKVYAVGDVVAEIVIPDMIVTSGHWLKIGITDDSDLSAMKVDVQVTNCY